MLINVIVMVGFMAFFIYTGLTVLNRSATSRKLEQKRNQLEEKRMIAEANEEFREIEKEIQRLDSQGDEEPEVKWTSEPEATASTTENSERTE